MPDPGLPSPAPAPQPLGLPGVGEQQRLQAEGQRGRRESKHKHEIVAVIGALKTLRNERLVRNISRQETGDVRQPSRIRNP